MRPSAQTSSARRPLARLWGKMTVRMLAWAGSCAMRILQRAEGGTGRSGRSAAARRMTWAAIFAAMLGIVAPARAQTAVDLQLVLAVDASGSVNETRFELQKEGYAAAFRNPRVLNAIRSGEHQAIAVTMVQWTGPPLQIQVLPWTRIGDAASIEAFAAAIEATPRRL